MKTTRKPKLKLQFVTTVHLGPTELPNVLSDLLTAYATCAPAEKFVPGQLTLVDLINLVSEDNELSDIVAEMPLDLQHEVASAVFSLPPQSLEELDFFHAVLCDWRQVSGVDVPPAVLKTLASFRKPLTEYFQTVMQGKVKEREDEELRLKGIWVQDALTLLEAEGYVCTKVEPAKTAERSSATQALMNKASKTGRLSEAVGALLVAEGISYARAYGNNHNAHPVHYRVHLSGLVKSPTDSWVDKVKNLPCVKHVGFDRSVPERPNMIVKLLPNTQVSDVLDQATAAGLL